MIAFGIPVKEFSFGDTLISGGVTAVVGGLVLFGLGLAVVQLQRIMDALAARPPMRVGRATEPFEPHVAAAARAARVSFPARPRPDRQTPGLAPESQPVSAEFAEADEKAVLAAPTLRNPDEPPKLAESTNAPLLPQESPSAAGELAGSASAADATPTSEAQPPEADLAPRTDTSRDRDTGADWRPATPPGRLPQKTFFDTMWPAGSRSSKAVTRETPPAPAEPADGGAEAKPSAPEPHAAAGEPRAAVPILKSGVVDGMGYTLYVDGSIEAELPDGKLRFASINELRAYLEKNS